MYLGVPGKVIEWLDHDRTFARASVECDGVRRNCYMACVPNVVEGDYVIVHAGIAICQLNLDESRCVLEELGDLEPVEPWCDGAANRVF